jgi:sensor histidine kinase YesM
MVKWMNKQKPLTLGFITGISCFIIGVVFSYFIDTPFDLINSLKLVGFLSSVMFLVSWGMFYQGERASRIFKEIDELYYSAKNVKTKTELTKIIKEYNNLKERADNQGHYAQLNIVKGVLETKQEYL